MNKKSLLRYSLLMAGLIFTLSLNAQRLVQPGVQIVDRFKPNVPSLVVKANPLTLPFGYFDAGVEYRNKSTGWVLMNHCYFGDENSIRITELSENFTVTSRYVRFEAAHRWYAQHPTALRANIERYTSIYLTAGNSTFLTSDTFEVDANGQFIFFSPLDEGSRIDLIVGAAFGRTRDYFGQSSPVYAETMWKFGYNLSINIPQVLYCIRFNYKVN